MSTRMHLISSFMRRKSLPPGPKGDRVMGVVRPMRNDPLQFLVESARAFPGICRLRFLHTNAFLIDDPALIAQVAVTNKKNYVRSPLYDVGRDVSGDGLFNAEGVRWRRQRKNINPGFHPKRIDAMLPRIGEICAAYVNNIESTESFRSGVDVRETMSRLMRDLVVNVLFGTNVGFDNPRITEAWAVINDEILERWWNLTKVSAALFPRRNPAFKDAMKVIDGFVYSVIQEKRKTGAEGSDLVSTFINIKDEETGLRLTDEQIRDEVVTFFLAGSDTSAMALSWALYLIGKRGDVKQKLFEEIDSYANEDITSIQKLSQYTYLRMVVDETLRLYPSVWGLSRLAVEPDKMGGYDIPAGSLMLISPYVVHRNQAHWKNPEAFDPERFAPTQKHAPFTYIPFGFGERTCIGSALALYEIMTALIYLLRRFDFELEQPEQVTCSGLITLQPNSLFVHFKPRAVFYSQRGAIFESATGHSKPSEGSGQLLRDLH